MAQSTDCNLYSHPFWHGSTVQSRTSIHTSRGASINVAPNHRLQFHALELRFWAQPVEHYEERSNSRKSQSFPLHQQWANTSSSKLKATSRDICWLVELEGVVLTNRGSLHFAHLILQTNKMTEVKVRFWKKKKEWNLLHVITAHSQLAWLFQVFSAFVDKTWSSQQTFQEKLGAVVLISCTQDRFTIMQCLALDWYSGSMSKPSENNRRTTAHVDPQAAKRRLLSLSEVNGQVVYFAFGVGHKLISSWILNPYRKREGGEGKFTKSVTDCVP